MNIERAMEDLSPILITYANPHNVGRKNNSRIRELRELLQEGAKFAFALFGQPCLWRFDWCENGRIRVGEGQLERSKFPRVEESAAHSETQPPALSLVEIVIWPRLLRVINAKGRRLVGDGRNTVYGEEKYLDEFLQ
jgi:hypothetical protein